MINKSLACDEVYQDQLENYKKKYDELQANYRMLERRANVSSEDAKLARAVVIEYANALTISKEQYKRMVKEINTVIKTDCILDYTRVYRIKEILTEHKRFASSSDSLTKPKLDNRMR